MSSNSRAKTRCTGFYWHLLYDIVSSNSKKNAPAYKLVSSLATTLESSWIEWRQNTGGDKLCWNFLHGIVSSNSQAKTRCIGIFFVRGIVPSISQAKTKCIGIYWDFLLPHQHVRATEGRRLQAWMADEFPLALAFTAKNSSMLQWSHDFFMYYSSSSRYVEQRGGEDRSKEKERTRRYLIGTDILSAERRRKHSPQDTHQAHLKLKPTDFLKSNDRESPTQQHGNVHWLKQAGGDQLSYHRIMVVGSLFSQVHPP